MDLELQLSMSLARRSWGTRPSHLRSTVMFRHIFRRRRQRSRQESNQSSDSRLTVEEPMKKDDQPGRTTSHSSLPPPLAIETSIKSLPDRIEITIITLQYPGVTLQQMPAALSLFQDALGVSSPAASLAEKELLSITTTLTFNRHGESSSDSGDSSGTTIT